jgi:hypothetical protein
MDEEAKDQYLCLLLAMEEQSMTSAILMDIRTAFSALLYQPLIAKACIPSIPKAALPTWSLRIRLDQATIL